MNSLDAMMPRAFPTLGFCGVSTVVAAGIGAIYSRSVEGAVTGATLNLATIGAKVVLDAFLRTGETKTGVVFTAVLGIGTAYYFLENLKDLSNFAISGLGDLPYP